MTEAREEPAFVRWLVGGLLVLALRPAPAGPGLPDAVHDALAGRPTALERASVRELRALPGLGEARASAAVDLRWTRSGAARLDDVRGIGEVTAARVSGELARRRARARCPVCGGVERPAGGASEVPWLSRRPRARSPLLADS